MVSQSILVSVPVNLRKYFKSLIFTESFSVLTCSILSPLQHLVPVESWSRLSMPSMLSLLEQLR